MVTIRIGEASRSYEDASPSWINQQINRRLEDGARICVQVTMRLEGVDFTLSSQGCGRGGGGGRQLSSREQEILDLWKRNRLDTPDFQGGNLVAFLNQLNI